MFISGSLLGFGKTAKKAGVLLLLLLALLGSMPRESTAQSISAETLRNIAQARAQNPGGTGSTPAPNGSCSIWPGSFSLKNCTSWILAHVSYALLKFFAFILWVSQAIFETALQKTVIDMKDNLEGFGGINVAWKAIRDVANMFFIFILLYTAIGTVLNLDSVNIKRNITRVVIAALLINFSMFFTKAAVDASNIFTIGFYDAIRSGAPNNQITAAFMQPLGLSSMLSWDKAIDGLMSSNAPQAIFINGIMGSVLTLMLAIVFFIAAIMFLIRFAIIVFLLVLSPIYFAAIALPNLKSYSGQWTQTLTGQIIFAPLFMMMSWLVLKLMSGTFPFNNMGSPDAMASISSGNIQQSFSAAGLVVNYIVVMAFIIGTLVISKSLASKGGGVAGSMMGGGAKWAGAAAGGAIFGGAAALYRNSAGRLANRYANDDELKAKAKDSKFAKLRLKTYQAVSKTTGDVRNAPMLGATFAKVDAGKGTSKNFAALAKEKKDKDAAFNKDALAAKKRIETKKTIEDGLAAHAAIEDGRKSGRPLTGQDLAFAQNRVNAMRQQVQSLPKDKIKDYVPKDKVEDVMGHLTPEQFNALMKNDDISDSDKAKYKGKRYGALSDAVTKKDKAAIVAELAKVSRSELQHLDSKNWTNADFVQGLSQEQFNGIMKNEYNYLSVEQKRDIAKLRIQNKVAALKRPQAGAQPGMRFGTGAGAQAPAAQPGGAPAQAAQPGQPAQPTQPAAPATPAPTSTNTPPGQGAGFYSIQGSTVAAGGTPLGWSRGTATGQTPANTTGGAPRPQPGQPAPAQPTQPAAPATPMNTTGGAPRPTAGTGSATPAAPVAHAAPSPAAPTSHVQPAPASPAAPTYTKERAQAVARSMSPQEIAQLDEPELTNPDILETYGGKGGKGKGGGRLAQIAQALDPAKKKTLKKAILDGAERSKRAKPQLDAEITRIRAGAGSKEEKDAAVSEAKKRSEHSPNIEQLAAQIEGDLAGFFYEG